MTNYPITADIKLYLDLGDGRGQVTGTVELGQIADDGSLSRKGIAEILAKVSDAARNASNECIKEND